MSDGGPVLPDLDVWVRAFGRLDPDPRIVHGFRELVRERRVLTLGGIRQGLLARLDDERQATRLGWILSGFPEVVLRPDDHLRAAELCRRLRRSDHRLSGSAALLWSVAERIGARIWSLDRRWSELARRGAPFTSRPVQAAAPAPTGS
jgi:predicted nucleic acid-binding protein